MKPKGATHIDCENNYYRFVGKTWFRWNRHMWPNRDGGWWWQCWGVCKDLPEIYPLKEAQYGYGCDS